MIVTCEKCQARYDDEFRWTICPHNVLEAAPDAPRKNCGKGYCAYHDLFVCPIESVEESATIQKRAANQE